MRVDLMALGAVIVPHEVIVMKESECFKIFSKANLMGLQFDTEGEE